VARIISITQDPHLAEVAKDLTQEFETFGGKLGSCDKPVTLPPGRAKLLTKPLPTGSPTTANTTGMVDVACLAASAAGVATVTMTSTLSRTNSAAMSA
jgi:hypothetical protein